MRLLLLTLLLLVVMMVMVTATVHVVVMDLLWMRVKMAAPCPYAGYVASVLFIRD